MMTNASLKAHFEKGHDHTSDGSEEAWQIFEYMPQHNGRLSGYVLEIGCGEGYLAQKIHSLGANVYGIDYVSSDGWLENLQDYPILQFGLIDYKDVKGLFDIVVMKGVLEHMDSPEETLTFIAENFKPNQIITSSPSFLNPRGYIWMALQYLFNYEMSLADLHFILPSDMEAWAEKLGYDIEYKSVDQDWGHGERLIEDFKKRLPKVFKDIEADIPKFMAWLEKTLPYTNYTEDSGATIVYNLRRT